MKKTLAVAAVLAAFAGTAAADVTVYGKVDLGLGYLDKDGDSKVEMVSGGSSTSRVGFKGSEKIGDMTVGFQYEGAVKADAGTGSFTDRISMVNVKGAYGEIGAGRYGVLDSATGPYDIAAKMTSFGSGWYDTLGDQTFVMQTFSRIGNAVTYKTPSFGGVTLYAQVASNTSTDDGEYTHEADMYLGVGATYQAGAFGANAVVSQMKWKNEAGRDNDALNITAGVNYAFDFATLYFAGNYYENGYEGHDQYGLVLGAKAPVMGGTLHAMVGYGDVSGYTDGVAMVAADKALADAGQDADKIEAAQKAQEAAVKEEAEKMIVGVAYQYPLSKQTYVYGGAGWSQTKTSETVDQYEAVFGICHNF